MIKDAYKIWLLKRFSSKLTAKSRFSLCNTIERYYGDLDQHYATDRCQSIMDELQYDSKDKRENRAPLHKIPIIKGDFYKVSATLRQALNRYIEFRDMRESQFELKSILDIQQFED